MTWRDGVHLTDASIWCDALRRRDVCFVSSADRIGRVSHGQLIGTPLTLALVGKPGGGHHSGSLAVPLRQRFTLGTQRLELIGSGRGPGAAALVVERGGRRLIYAGPIRTAPGAGDVAEVRTCDTLVVAAPYGDTRERFPSLAAAVQKTIAWTREQLAGSHRPVLLVDTVLDGLEVAGVLARAGIALSGSRALREAVRRAGSLFPIDAPETNPPRGRARRDTGVPSTLSIATPGREPRAVIWPVTDREALARSLAGKPHVTALVSARARTTSVTTDAVFAWANAADRTQLLAWIEATRAREVFVTGACADAIADALGPRARVLGPPQQLALFSDTKPKATRSPTRVREATR